jgi:hypothetical protein
MSVLPVPCVVTAYPSVSVLSTWAGLAHRSAGVREEWTNGRLEPQPVCPRFSLMGLFRDPLVLLLIAAAAAIAFFVVATSV